MASHTWRPAADGYRLRHKPEYPRNRLAIGSSMHTAVHPVQQGDLDYWIPKLDTSRHTTNGTQGFSSNMHDAFMLLLRQHVPSLPTGAVPLTTKNWIPYTQFLKRAQPPGCTARASRLSPFWCRYARVDMAYLCTVGIGSICIGLQYQFGVAVDICHPTTRCSGQ